MPNYIELEKGKIYGIKIPGGILRIDVSQDEFYPGADIEYISEVDDIQKASRPRILIERPIEKTLSESKLRALIWNNPKSEDYTEEIILEKE